jgi:hypothetical protein
LNRNAEKDRPFLAVRERVEQFGKASLSFLRVTVVTVVS